MSLEEIIAKLEEMADEREEKILPGCIGWDEIGPLREAAAMLRNRGWVCAEDTLPEGPGAFGSAVSQT